MKITIDVETWGQAHHLACVLADAEWKFRTGASTGGVVADALNKYADLFRRTARAITKQAEPLNEAAWLKRRGELCATKTSTECSPPETKKTPVRGSS